MKLSLFIIRGIIKLRPDKILKYASGNFKPKLHNQLLYLFNIFVLRVFRYLTFNQFIIYD
jgi:hypothetical protein